MNTLVAGVVELNRCPNRRRMETPCPVGWLPTMGLQQFEQRLERLVEGAFAKAFRSGLQPVEIGRRITREMDLGRRVGVRGLIAPNHFKVNLPSADFERFSSFARLARTRARGRRQGARTDRGLRVRRAGSGRDLRGP